MAHRLIGSKRTVDRILKNGLVTGNFNNLAQARPRHSEFRQLFSQSSVYLSHEPPKTFEKTLRPNSGSNDGGANADRKETTEATSTDKRTNNVFSAPLDQCAPKAPNQRSNFGGNNGGAGREKTTSSHESVMDKENVSETVFLAGFIIFGIWTVIDFWRTMQREKSYEEITWKEFIDNFLAKGRVTKVEVTDNNGLQVYIAPGASADDAKTFQLRLDSLDSHEIVPPVAKTMEMKAELKNEAPVADKNKVQPGGDPMVVD